MENPTDEMLMAYADGALDAAQTAAVEAYLARNPHARDVVAKLREAARLAKAAFETPMNEAPPSRLVDAIMSSGPQNLQMQDAGRVASIDQARARRLPAMRNWALAAAASVAVIVAGAGGYLAGRPDAGHEASDRFALGSIAAGSSTERILETSRSGQVLEPGSKDGSKGARLKIVATFRDKQGRPCREIEALGDDGRLTPTAAAVACRSSNGRWHIEGAARLTVGNAAQGVIKPSGSSERDPLEGVLQQLGAGPVLLPDEEQRMLSGNWK